MDAGGQEVMEVEELCGAMQKQGACAESKKEAIDQVVHARRRLLIN